MIVDHMFPNIGGDVEKSETGTITELVRPQKKSNPLLFLSVGSAIAMVLIIIAAAFLVRRARVTGKAKTTTDLTQVTFLKLEPKTWRHEDVAAQHS